MGLKEKIKDFNLRDNEGIDKDDNNGKISEAFKQKLYCPVILKLQRTTVILM